VPFACPMHDEAQLILQACPENGKGGSYLSNAAPNIDIFLIEKLIHKE
jgi:hypothetical protein